MGFWILDLGFLINPLLLIEKYIFDFIFLFSNKKFVFGLYKRHRYDRDREPELRASSLGHLTLILRDREIVSHHEMDLIFNVIIKLLKHYVYY